MHTAGHSPHWYCSGLTANNAAMDAQLHFVRQAEVERLAPADVCRVGVAAVSLTSGSARDFIHHSVLSLAAGDLIPCSQRRDVRS